MTKTKLLHHAPPASRVIGRGSAWWTIAVMIGLACAFRPAPAAAQNESAGDIPSPEMSNVEAPIIAKIDEARKAILEHPDSADAWGRYGWILMAHHWPFDAVKCFDQAAKLNDQDFRWPYLAGLTVIRSDADKAIGYFKRCVGLKPDFVPGRFRYCRALFNSDKKSEGLKEFDKAVKELPDSLHIWLAAGHAYVDAGQIDRAKELFDHAAKTWPQSRTVQESIGQFYGKIKDEENFRIVMEKASQLPFEPPLTDPVGEAVRADSVGSEHLIRQGREHFAAGRFDKAIASWELALEANPKSLPAHAFLGMAFAGTGRLGIAVKHLEAALALSPDNADLLHQLGDVFRRQGKTSEAAQMLRKGLAIRPDSPGALLSLGQCYADLGETRDAVQLIEKSLQIRPNLPGAWAVLSQTHLAGGDAPHAIESAEKAIQRFPQFSGLYVTLSVALEENKEYAKSISVARKAAQITPDDPAAHNLLAWVLLTSGDVSLRDPVEAITEAKRAAELAPESAEILNTLAMAYLRNEKYQEAIDSTRKTIDQRKGEPVDAAILAIAYLHLGKKSEAEPYLQQLRKSAGSASAKPLHVELLKEAESLVR